MSIAGLGLAIEMSSVGGEDAGAFRTPASVEMECFLMRFAYFDVAKGKTTCLSPRGEGCDGTPDSDHVK